MENEEITIVIAEQDLEEIMEYELDNIKADPALWNLGRAPLDPYEIDGARYQDPIDTLEHIVNCAPVQSFRGGE